MRQDIDIDQLMAETWLTVTMLKKVPSRLMALRFTTNALNRLKLCGKRWSVPVMTKPVWSIFPTHNVPCWTKR